MLWLLELDVKSRKDFFFKMGEIAACLHIDGTDTATVHKTLISRISVINVDSGKDGKCNIF